MKILRFILISMLALAAQTATSQDTAIAPIADYYAIGKIRRPKG